MGRPAELVAWLLSLAGLALASGALGDVRLEGASALGTAALPWIALAGLPRGARGAHRAAVGVGAGHAVLLALAGALPLLAWGAGLEVAAGRTDAAALGSLAQLLAVVLLLAGAAALAAPRPAEVADAWLAPAAAHALHGALWLLLLPGAAALAVALGWAPATGGAAAAALARGEGAGWGAVARWCPLAWAHALAAGRAGTELALGPLAVAALLLVPGLLSRARAQRGSEERA